MKTAGRRERHAIQADAGGRTCGRRSHARRSSSRGIAAGAAAVSHLRAGRGIQNATAALGGCNTAIVRAGMHCNGRSDGRASAAWPGLRRICILAGPARCPGGRMHRAPVKGALPNRSLRHRLTSHASPEDSASPVFRRVTGRDGELTTSARWRTAQVFAGGCGCSASDCTQCERDERRGDGCSCVACNCTQSVEQHCASTETVASAQETGA